MRAKEEGNRLRPHSIFLRQDSDRVGPASTPTELAGVMGWDKTSVRPRLTELVDMGRATTTGTRRDSQHVFFAITEQKQSQFFT
jgi:DNA-binding MarR family transcriptional regulator